MFYEVLDRGQNMKIRGQRPHGFNFFSWKPNPICALHAKFRSISSTGGHFTGLFTYKSWLCCPPFFWWEQDILRFTLYRKALWAASLITKVKPDVQTPFTRLKFGPMRRLHAQMLAPHWSKLHFYKGCPHVRLSLSELRHHSFSWYWWPLHENVWLQWGYLTTHHPNKCFYQMNYTPIYLWLSNKL